MFHLLLIDSQAYKLYKLSLHLSNKHNFEHYKLINLMYFVHIFQLDLQNNHFGKFDKFRLSILLNSKRQWLFLLLLDNNILLVD